MHPRRIGGRPAMPWHDRCACLACQKWWAELVKTGDLVAPRPIRRPILHHSTDFNGKKHSRIVSYATTWRALQGDFLWHDKIALHETVIVLGAVPKDASGGHLDAVYVLWMRENGEVDVRACQRHAFKVIASAGK